MKNNDNGLKINQYQDEAKEIYDGTTFWELSEIYEKNDEIRKKIGNVYRCKFFFFNYAFIYDHKNF